MALNEIEVTFWVNRVRSQNNINMLFLSFHFMLYLLATANGI